METLQLKQLEEAEMVGAYIVSGEPGKLKKIYDYSLALNIQDSQGVSGLDFRRWMAGVLNSDAGFLLTVAPAVFWEQVSRKEFFVWDGLQHCIKGVVLRRDPVTKGLVNSVLYNLEEVSEELGDFLCSDPEDLVLATKDTESKLAQLVSTGFSDGYGPCYYIE